LFYRNTNLCGAVVGELGIDAPAFSPVCATDGSPDANNFSWPQRSAPWLRQPFVVRGLGRSCIRELTMALLETFEISDFNPQAISVPQSMTGSIAVKGKFFFAGEQKHFVKGVTYGPFPAASHGAPFPERHIVEKDFSLMSEIGINTIRVFTVPPPWLLDAAYHAGLWLLVGLPWPQHVTFLDSPAIRREIKRTVIEGVCACRQHPAVFAYLIGNEIPPDVIRWHGAARVREFLGDLVGCVRREHPRALVSYANFPSTEYLTVDLTDFVCFNVYLHDEASFRRYVARLHNLAPDRPLVLTEFGVDSIREGEEGQRRVLSWQVRTAFETGVAGTCVFSWTDEWFTGGHLIEDWAFGLVDRERRPKPSLYEVERCYTGPLPPPLPHYPRVSVVVCAYNAERTLDACLASLAALNYPDYEVIVVNDGSRDRTLEIAESHPYCRIVSQPNKGLSTARNVGAEAATGEIVAYTDSDCVADPDWLTYLVAKMEAAGLVACGGPNFPPPEDSLVPAAVAVAPGGPTHVLLSDEVAEHIAGCNMAFRREVLLGLGGFDPVYRAAGDDIDICWRIQDAGFVIGFSPAAIVWHFRRNTVKAYCNQQRGYGKAEALVYSKHPFRFNLFGQAKWLGRIYGDLSTSLLLSRRPVIYSGVFGRGLFQTLYEPPSSLTAFLPLSFEWGAAAIVLAMTGLVGGGWWLLLLVPLLATWAMCINGAVKAPIDKRFSGIKARALVALLIYLGPLLRGWERIRWRVRETRAQPHAAPAQTEQRARVWWLRQAFDLAFWSETGTEKEALIGGLMQFLVPQKYFVVPDAGWSGWDLKIARGLCSRALILVCTENHGGAKRLLRVRCTMRLSRLAIFLLRGYALLTALALLLGWPVAAAVVAGAGLLNLAAMGTKLTAFARLMHRIVEAVARPAGLIPVEPRSDARAPSPAAQMA
jgi:O-antigen biosynthesis protein